MMRKPKHVVFLGAGASASSKYPVADQLRKEWLSSPEILLSKAIDQITRPPPSDPNCNRVHDEVRQLSMHSYLNLGFRYLFEGRTQLPAWRITDSRSVGEKPWEQTSPTVKACELFEKLKVEYKRPIVRQNFAEFIEKDVS